MAMSVSYSEFDNAGTKKTPVTTTHASTRFFKIDITANEPSEGEFTQDEINTIFNSEKTTQLGESSPLFRGTFDMKEYCVLLNAIRRSPESVVSITTPQIIREYIHRYGRANMFVLVAESIRNLACEWIRAFIEIESVRRILNWNEITKEVFKVVTLQTFRGRHGETLCVGSDSFNSLYKNAVKLLIDNREKIGISMQLIVTCLENALKEWKRSTSNVLDLYNSVRDYICGAEIVMLNFRDVTLSDALGDISSLSDREIHAICLEVPSRFDDSAYVTVMSGYIFDKLDINSSNVDKYKFLTDVGTVFNALYKKKYMHLCVTDKNTDMLHKFCDLFVKDDQSMTQLVFSLCTTWPEAVNICVDYAKKNNIDIQWGRCKNYFTVKVS